MDGVQVSTTTGRNFSGVVGLKEGYGDGIVHDRAEVIKVWNKWVMSQAKKDLPWLGIRVGPVEDLLYAFDEQGVLSGHQEPVVAVCGEIASYQEHLTDKQVVETLQSLFAKLADVLKQTTVRFTYHGVGPERTSYRLRMPKTKHPLD